MFQIFIVAHSGEGETGVFSGGASLNWTERLSTESLSQPINIERIMVIISETGPFIPII